MKKDKIFNCCSCGKELELIDKKALSLIYQYNPLNTEKKLGVHHFCTVCNKKFRNLLSNFCKYRTHREKLKL